MTFLIPERNGASRNHIDVEDMSLDEAMGSDLKKQDRILDSSKANELGNKSVGRIASKFNSQHQNDGWENLPPYKQLKVLLAEDDDSTRHVVAALLRNCGYHVVCAPNGLQAWAFLEDPSRDFDLVLTDVVMPGLSGIGLLSRIVHHESYKRIPVVMMSSHDSTDLVFKCLSKGAADFLVKPVRKNELKNLWQHSWRKCQSASGSGSGCDTERFNRRHKDEISSAPGSSDDVSLPDHSDNGSATQTSCTKKVAELESPRRLKPLRRRPIGRDSEPIEGLDPSVRNTEEEADPCPDNNGTNQACSMDQAVDLLGNIANEQSKRSRLNEEAGSERGESNSLEAKDGNSNSASRLELSLRSSCADQPATDGVSERNMLRHSGASAFSRYNTLGGTSRQQPSLVKVVDFNSGRSGCHLEPHRNADGVVVRQAEDGSCPADKDGDVPLSHRPDHMVAPQMIAHPGMPVQYAALLSYDHGMPAYFYAQPALPPWQHAFSPQGPHEEAQGEGHHHHHIQQQYQQQYTHHHHHHIEHHHHHHHKEAEGNNNNNNETRVKHESPLGAEAAVCGSTNAADGGNNTNNGLSGSSHGYGNGNGSMSGSNNGSNGFNNNNNNNKNNITLAGDSGSGNLISNSASCLSIPPNSNNEGPEQNRVARREAALTKFRQKRKERCFEKKVRYQSRKRLAEQRPRVRGQFVSQSVHDSSKLDFQQY